VSEPDRIPDRVNDGVERRLDPRVIPLQQLTGQIASAVIAFGSIAGTLILWVEGAPLWLLLPLWLFLNGLLTWHSQRWPAIAYRHSSYRVDDAGIEISEGVYWRTVTNVPFIRVQHTDVSQGPLERRFGLGTLVIYTAGTDHAKVTLAGLEHGTALRIREHLLPRETSDAV
jgi:uncharacterized protein